MGAFAIFIGNAGPNPFSIRIATPAGNLAPAAAIAATSGGTPAITSPAVAARGPAIAATFLLDVDQGAQVVYSWATDVIPARSGRENRLGVRTTPREAYAFDQLITDAQIAALQSALVFNAAAASAFGVALGHESLLVTATTSGTTITVASTTYCDWAYPGQRVACVAPDGKTFALAVVQNSGPTSIVVDVAFGSAISVIGARVMPVISCWLEPAQGLGLYPANAGRYVLKARAAYFGNRLGAWAPNGAALTTYTDPLTAQVFPVYDRPLEVDQTSPRAIVSGALLLDRGGQISQFGPQRISRFAREIFFHARTDADRQYLKLFAGTVVGRQKVFLLPTWKPDLVPLGDAHTSTLLIQGPPTVDAGDYAGQWVNSLAHTHIQLMKADGTIAYRTISDSLNNGDGTQTLQLDSALTGALAQVSFLEQCRLDTDDVVVAYDTDVGASRIPCMVVQK